MPAPPSGSRSGRPAPEPPRFQEGQVVTVFRSRRRAGAEAEYGEVAAAMLDAARGFPGFVDFKSFHADDGEHVSLVTFASEETHRAWREDPRHREAQARGRAAFYEEYSIQSGPATHVRRWSVELDG